MAARYGAGQYEDSFSPHRLQNWSVAQPRPQRPPPRAGSTLIIADDRGHLLPTAPRSQESPWGTFVGTWEMPPRIPPARLDLTSRSAAAAARLLGWVQQPSALTRAANGLRTQITGKPQEPRLDTRTAKEPSPRSSRAHGEDTQPGAPPRAALEELPEPRAGATAPPSGQSGCVGVQLKAATSPEPPAAPQPGTQQSKLGGQTPRPHQCAGTDAGHRDTGSARVPSSISPAPREASPQQTTPLQGSVPSRGGSH